MNDTRTSLAERPRHEWGPVVLIMAIVALMLGNVVGLATINPARLLYPKAWDARVVEIANWVEKERELPFRHPVEVKFLADSEYKKTISSETTVAASEDDVAALARFEGTMRALGLLPAGTSVLDAGSDLATEGTLAYYHHEAKHIVVRGTELTPGVRVTLAHELTHVLQDQHFSLDREFETSSQQSVFDALVEGDAERIGNAYADELSDTDRAAKDAADDAALDADPLADVPPALVQLFAAPYALGTPFVDFLLQARGNAGINDVLRAPPVSEEGLFDPFAYLAGDPVKDVAFPELARGERETDAGAFGPVGWFVTLASHVDDRTALRAVDGWGGDAYVGYQANGRDCMRIRFAGDTPKDVDEMAVALDEWARAFPSGAASSKRVGRDVEMTACDAGDKVPPPAPGIETALAVPANRTALATQLLEDDVPEPLAECAAGKIINLFTTPQLLADALPPGFDPAAAGFEAGQACAREAASR